MAVLMTEGFDMYNGSGANIGLLAMWNSNSNCGLVSGRFGGQALNIFGTIGGSNTSTARVFDPAAATTSMSFGVAIWTSSITSGDKLWEIDNGSGGALCSFGFTSSGAIYAASGSFGSTLCTSGAALFAAAAWAYLEAEIVLHASAGSINLYLNGALVASATGVNTLAAGGAGSLIRAWGRNANGLNTLFDDIYVTSGATRLGERRIETLRPSADISVAWTPSSGANNYGRVNETLVDGDTSYVQTATTGARDLYANGGMSSTPTSISAVTVVSFAEKTDATTRQIYNSVKSGATDSDGPAFNLAPSYGRYDRIIETDPNTSAAWTPPAVNNLLFGPKAA
jgi:hypothetical protein